MDRYSEARKGNQDTYFRNQILDVLERIAVALENPLREVRADKLSPSEWEQDPIRAAEERYADDNPEPQPTHLTGADTCRCGNDPWITCDHCSAARLAFVLTQRERI